MADASAAPAEAGGEGSPRLALAMREKVRKMAAPDLAAFRDICEANGIGEDAVVEKNDRITRVEMFMMNYPVMRGLQLFSHLTELAVTCQEVSAIANLQPLHRLERLWLSENRIARIENLDSLTALQELYLYSNRIRHVENLHACTNLRKIWLADNNIHHLPASALAPLTNLEEINLAANKLDGVGDALLPTTKLHTLNLAANLIGSFREVSSLARLPSLSNLALSDPHWGASPVSELCNYHTYALFHLGASLTQLDTWALAPDAVSTAEATFMKKRMYYNMRCKTLKRNTTDAIRRAREGLRRVSRRAHLARALALRQAKAYEREVAIGGGSDAAANPSTEAIADKLAQLRSVVTTCEQQVAATEMFFGEAERRTHELADTYTRRMIVELETGGNVRFEDGKPSDLWFTSCVDLVHSRFFDEDYASYGISGIRVNRVSRVHNRFLRTRFDMALSAKVDTSDSSHKRTMEYLFYGEPVAMRGELQRAAEEGFRSPSEYASVGLDGAIVLSNSLSMSDAPRLAAAFDDAKGAGPASPPEKRIRRGRMLVTKVFLGKCVAEDASAAAGSLRRATSLQSGNDASARCVMREAYGDVDSVYRAMPNDQKQRLWYVFDPHLCLPEYIVDFEYEFAQQDEMYGVVSAAADGSSTVTRAPALISAQPDGPDDAARRQAELLQLPAEMRALAAPLAPFLVERTSASGKGEVDWDAFDGGRDVAEASLAESGATSLLGEDDELASIANGATVVADAVDALAAAERLLAATDACIDAGAIAGGDVAAASSVLEPTIGNAGGNPTTVARVLCSAPILGEKLKVGSLAAAADVQAAVDEMKGHVEKAALRAQVPTDPSEPSLKEGMAAVFGVDEVANLSDITRVDMYNRSLVSLQGVETTFPGVTTLLASFNAIERISGIEKCAQLRVLDLSYNRIHRIEGLKSLGNLRCLLLDGNPIHRLDDINVLRKYTPDLTELSFYGCPIRERRGYVGLVLRRLTSLKRLDGRVVGEHPDASANGVDGATQGSMASADPNGIGCTLTPALLMEGAHTRRRSLLSWGASSGGDDGEGADGDAPPSAVIVGLRGAPSPEWWAGVEEICIEHRRVRRLQNLQVLGPSCRRISFCDNDISRMQNFETLTNLEELNLESNRIEVIEGLGQCSLLRRLDLGKNCIRRIDDSLMHLDRLTQLSLEDNELASLSGLEHLAGLMELYIANNRLAQLRDLMVLKKLPRLIILDLMGNPLCEDARYRLYTIFHLTRLKVLDGVSIETAEVVSAKAKYSGVLSSEWLEEKVGHTCFSKLRDLDMSGHRLKDVGDVFVRDGSFLGLERLRLDGNNLSSVAGLRGLASLCVLCLNSNKLGDAPICGPLTDLSTAHWTKRESTDSKQDESELLMPDWAQVTRAGGFPSLVVIQLGGNGISSIASLALAPVGKRLRSLFLQDNDLVRIDGLDGLPELRELVLDRNRIKAIEPSVFEDCPLLRELRMEENQLRGLGGFEMLPKLRVLRVGHNRIADMNELDKLAGNVELVDLVVYGNPLARKPVYRSHVVRRLPSVRRCDGKDVTPEEREAAELAALQSAAIGAEQVSGVVIPNSAGPGPGKQVLRMTSISFSDLTPHANGYIYDDSAGAAPPRAPLAGVAKDLMRERLVALQSSISGASSAGASAGRTSQLLRANALSGNGSAGGRP